MKSGRTGAVAALAGALALSALTAPTATAADTSGTVTEIVVNGGKPIVVGTAEVKRVPVSYRVNLPAGYSAADPYTWNAGPYLYHGTTAVKGASSGGIYPSEYGCYEVAVRTAQCAGIMSVDPRYDLDSNGDATAWTVGYGVVLFGNDNAIKSEKHVGTSGRVQVRRYAKATVNAAPEPVAKGKPITVTGTLKRADWVKHTYTGVADASVQLQFRPKGTTSYETVKTVRSSSTGALRATVTATLDGDWRWSFGGWSTTGSAVSAGDYVDVSGAGGLVREMHARPW
ncbi:hypothetical protein AB0L33_07260 [Streptomyces sp. NPDC052299]|uniref:hypothetical protein n=1 Tax=Streptomyces sp. NPDC052299 TaxID=3155054 RepID=UPI00341A191A